jgi:hypothetical protein
VAGHCPDVSAGTESFDRSPATIGEEIVACTFRAELCDGFDSFFAGDDICEEGEVLVNGIEDDTAELTAVVFTVLNELGENLVEVLCVLDGYVAGTGSWDCGTTLLEIENEGIWDRGKECGLALAGEGHYPETEVFRFGGIIAAADSQREIICWERDGRSHLHNRR